MCYFFFLPVFLAAFFGGVLVDFFADLGVGFVGLAAGFSFFFSSSSLAFSFWCLSRKVTQIRAAKLAMNRIRDIQK